LLGRTPLVVDIICRHFFLYFKNPLDVRLLFLFPCKSHVCQPDHSQNEYEQHYQLQECKNNVLDAQFFCFYGYLVLSKAIVLATYPLVHEFYVDLVLLQEQETKNGVGVCVVLTYEVETKSKVAFFCPGVLSVWGECKVL
jgi:hypothetical protein